MFWKKEGKGNIDAAHRTWLFQLIQTANTPYFTQNIENQMDWIQFLKLISSYLMPNLSNPWLKYHIVF